MSPIGWSYEVQVVDQYLLTECEISQRANKWLANPCLDGRGRRAPLSCHLRATPRFTLLVEANTV